jgi:hypothetical protein
MPGRAHWLEGRNNVAGNDGGIFGYGFGHPTMLVENFFELP